MEMEDIDMQSQNQPLTINEIDEDLICQNIIEEGEEPISYVGVDFSSVEEAYDFYNMYAKKKGFSVRKYDIKRLKSGEVASRLFVCNKEGFKSHTDKRRVGKDFKPQRNERQGCPAQMRIHNNNGIWTIKVFVEEHNHDLFSTPSKVQLLRSHNTSHLNTTCKVLFDQFRSCGEGPSKIAKLVNATSGSTSVNITTQQCVDYFRSERKSNVGHECLTMIEKLLARQATDSQFYYSIEKDDNNVCRSIFWADGRARTSYLHFGDVIVFDVTYKTNNFLLPFAPFTGVNHHRQSTLFGCALLADETEETFVWLFQHWLACMWDKAPVAIITDHDSAICSAIKRVFPNTCHRYCIWHIGLHEDEHLRSLRSSYNPGFDKDYANWAKYSQTVEESEENWLKLNQCYKHDFEEPLSEKQKNLNKSWKWLDAMYNKRKHWVEAYSKDTFFAGMRSSQRSESMNSYFDGFVNSMTPLYKFIEQYDKALSIQRKKEEREDTYCMRSNPDIRGMHDLEAHASKVYTRKLFEIFHVQFKNTWSCWHEKVSKEGGIATYKVISKIDGVESSSLVACNASQQEFKCICGKFETDGILCSHILYIMKQKLHLQLIPDRYILSRWTLTFRYSTTSLGYIPIDLSNELKGKTVTTLQSWTLRATFDKIVQDASVDSERYNMALELAKSYWKNHDLMEESRPSFNSEGLTQIGSSDPVYIEGDVVEEPIYNPARAKTKGCPRAISRIQSGKEASQAQAQIRTRTCSICKEKGHNMRTCSQSKEH